MKKLLDSNLFVAVMIALQILFLAAGVLVAIYDDGHASVALLFMVIAFLFVLNIALALIALLVRTTKKWYYLALMLFWIFLYTPMYYQNFADEYEMEEMMEELEMERMIHEDMQRDSIRLNSIDNK